jgi:hypothetical protein
MERCRSRSRAALKEAPKRELQEPMLAQLPLDVEDPSIISLGIGVHSTLAVHGF